MPKWTEYTTKDTLADNDEVMLYDATTRANKRGLMSKFWDYVVDKMATAVISKLETENKTVIGALNYLNGKTSKTNFNGNVSRVVFRSGSSGIDNSYLDFYTTDGKRTTIGFYTDGMNGIQMMKDNAPIWTIKA
jgi:hypothetical protein